jgi:hypothetical protein
MPSPRFRQIRDRLPSLYRPEEGDESLLVSYLLAAADLLDDLNGEATGVMQAHWFPAADRALLSPFFRRGRELEKQPMPPLGDPELERFPHIGDLARLGSLLGVLPWGGPPAQRETVELYRRRIADTVAIYREGLGTPAALARMVRVQLPDDLTRPPGQRERPFLVEEFPSILVPPRPATSRGAPDGVVGPLMRWPLDNAGIGPAAPTVYIQGVAPEAGKIAATERPVLELYAAGSRRVRLGIAYNGTLAAGQTLRLRPAHAFWIGRTDGIRQALAMPEEGVPANPATPGPWEVVPGAPKSAVAAFVQSRDNTVWTAVAASGSGALWRFNGTAWSEALKGLPPIHCLALDGDDLLAGTAKGLLRIPLHAVPPGPLVPQPKPEQLAGPAIHAILYLSDGRWWLGTEKGAARLGPADALEPVGPETPVYALHQDATGTLHLGTKLGLFQLQPGPGHWYWYAGESPLDEAPAWQRFLPKESKLPAAERAALPPVRCIRRGPDASLWIGTDRGIARYGARPAGGSTSVTQLEELADLATGPVFAIEEDSLGALWFATGKGLFRYDGRDWWQGQEGEVRALLWTDRVVADLGAWDEGTATFTKTGDALDGLRMRYKPDELRSVDGGVVAVPRLPAGRSVWRYLSLEIPFDPLKVLAVSAIARPRWNPEGRLLSSTDRSAPEEARFGGSPQPAASGDAVFPFPPAARVWFAWEERRPLTLLVRLRADAGEAVGPEILDRVWQGIQQVRPAGLRALLAVNEEIVRGA